jgi:long-chain acyl-CoA synthetase
MKPWLSAYPEGVPAEIDTTAYSSLVDLMQESFRLYGDRTAFSFLGKGLTYKELDRLSQVFAAYLQSLGLVFGDRVAIMLPNVLQYPIAVAAVLRAGFVVVNRETQMPKLSWSSRTSARLCKSAWPVPL